MRMHFPPQNWSNRMCVLNNIIPDENRGRTELIWPNYAMLGCRIEQRTFASKRNICIRQRLTKGVSVDWIKYRLLILKAGWAFGELWLCPWYVYAYVDICRDWGLVWCSSEFTLTPTRSQQGRCSTILQRNKYIHYAREFDSCPDNYFVSICFWSLVLMGARVNDGHQRQWNVCGERIWSMCEWWFFETIYKDGHATM